MKTINEIQNIINSLIVENEKDLLEYNELLEKLKPFHWKKLNGVTFKKFNRRIECWNFYIDRFNLWSVNNVFNRSWLFDINDYIRSNTRASTGAIERLEQLQNLDPALLCEKYNTLYNAVKTAKEILNNDFSYKNPASYEILWKFSTLSNLFYRNSI